MDIVNYLPDYMQYMKDYKVKLSEELGETNETVRWLKEILFLLGNTE